MGRVYLSTPATEGSTFVVPFSLTSDDGTTVTPSTARWSLTDMAGDVINERSAVVIASPAVSNEIVLTGDDLAGIANDAGYRVITVSGNYVVGEGVFRDFIEEIVFSIEGRVL